LDESAVSWKTTNKGTSFAALGALEAELLTLVWEREPEAASVRDIYEEILAKRRIAYTTVMTVLGNLMKKGLLVRDESQTAYLYRAAIPASEVAGQVLESLIATLYRGRSGVAATRLLGLPGEFTEEQLEELRACGRRLLTS
jgi:predicted transcriptional regulator